MSTLKADAVTTKSDNTDLTLTGGGTGVPNLEAGFKIGGTAGVPVSELRAGTDGELITWDASGDPATVAVGTATHVLTSNGAGAAPTFQAAGGGAWNVIGSTVASDDATITITGLDSTYEIYAIGFSSIIFAAAERLMEIQIGDSGGIITASNYRFNRMDMHTTSADEGGMNNDGGAEWEVNVGGGGGSGTAYETFGGMFFLQSIQDTWPLLQGTSSNIHADGQGRQSWFGGQYTANETVTQLRFRANAGNITSGRITVWGLAHA
jgi:hypothetical protein